MSTDEKPPFKLLSTGVPGLDEVLGGGLPEFSFNMIAGMPGAGKTTLAHQLTFANASADRPAIYFTVLGEPSLKMLRYQQQMAFFIPEKVGSVIRFVDLSQDVLAGDLERLLSKIIEEVKETRPAIVVVDSIRTVMRVSVTHGEAELQSFLQRLALHLTSWHVTSFLLGEFDERDMHRNPMCTIADGIVSLSQSKERSSIVRRMQVMKMRGMSSSPGLHTFRISSQGVHVFPRAARRGGGSGSGAFKSSHERVPTGVAGLDEMLSGGLLRGDVTLVAGPSGTGKTVLATHFISEGFRRGENGVLAIFEEFPDAYLDRALDLGFDLREMIGAKRLEVISLQPLDLSVDEIFHNVKEAVTRLQAGRLVIDSVNGLELAVAPHFRQDFNESLYHLVGELTRRNVNALLTVEVEESFDNVRFSPHAVAFLAQNVLFLRYVEIESRLQKMVAVVKMRRSKHSTDLRAYEITRQGMKVAAPLTGYTGLLMGAALPSPLSERLPPKSG